MFDRLSKLVQPFQDGGSASRIATFFDEQNTRYETLPNMIPSGNPGIMKNFDQSIKSIDDIINDIVSSKSI